MRRLASGAFLFAAAVASAAAATRGVAGRLSAFPASFEPNVGQAPAEVRFVAHGPGYAVALRDDGADILVCSAAPGCRSGGGRARLFFEGADPHPRLAGESALPGRTNFLRGPDPAAWRTDVVTWTSVRYRDLWPGIDLVYRGSAGALEYDFVLAPGADPRRIALRYEDRGRVALDRHGDLVIGTAAGALVHHKPVVFQKTDGGRVEIEGRFVVKNGRVGFEVGRYDRTRELVIDPALAFSTYVGEWFVYGMAVDSAGNAYLAGTILSPPLTTRPVPPATGLQKTFGGATTDAFVVKVAARGDAFLWATYLGGSADDEALAIAVDADGNACVAGRTFSSDFPYKNGFQTRGSAFVARLSADGSRLLYSTGFGGSGIEVVNAIVVDSAGSIFLAGEAGSSDFPALNAFQTVHRGPSDAFVAKIGPTGALAYATLLGGDSFEEAFGVAVDSGGRAFVTGYTYSGNFPVKNGPQAVFGGQNDGFLSVISPEGSALLASTYFGGAGRDVGHGVAVGPAAGGEEPVLLVGSQDPPGAPSARVESARALRHAPEGSKVYETSFRFTTASPALAVSRALDGGLDGIALFAQADALGGFAVAGQTNSASLATVNPIQPQPRGFQDVFVQVGDFSGNVRFASYFGGSGLNLSLGVAGDGLGNVWVAGEADAGDLTLKNPIPGYATRGFLAKIAGVAAPAPCVAGATALCLRGGRFKIEAAWRIPSTGQSGPATMVPMTPDAGSAWFFNADSPELVIKIVDGRAFNNRFWVFSGALTNVEYTITVTDSATGAVKTYFNPFGTIANVADTAAF